MSGQIHHELIMARAGGLAWLTRSEFIFLTTVAARCDPETRRGWCSTDEIAHAVGGRKPGTPAGARTVERLRKQLVLAGFLVVVRKGTGTHGKSYATVYEIPVQPDFEPATMEGGFTAVMNPPNEPHGPAKRGLEPAKRALEPANMDGGPTSFATTRNTTSLDNALRAREEPSPLGSVFSRLFGDGHNDTETPALEAPKTVQVQSMRPLADDERCPHHDTPDPGCVICRAFGRARGDER
jgi:hypothetical protein